jgi:hypothetical protein
MLVLLTVIILFTLPAFAQSSDVNGAFSITLPDDMKSAEISDEDKAGGLLLNMQSDSMQAVAYIYEPEPNERTLDEMYQEYLAEQQEGFFANVAIEDIHGTRMIVYGDEGRIGAITVAAGGYAYEFIMILAADSARDAAKAAIESIAAVAA